MNRMLGIFKIIVIIVLILPITLQVVSAQSVGPKTDVFTGQIIDITNTPSTDNEELNVRQYFIEINVDGEDQVVESTDTNRPELQDTTFKIGDKVVVDRITVDNETVIYQITDYVRTTPMIFLFLLFITLTVLIARKKGIASLFGLGISFVIIFSIVLPLMLSGHDPLIVTVGAACIMIPANFYLSHGYNRKTTYAIASTIMTLVITGLLSLVFVSWTKLSGFTSDEAGFLDALSDGQIDIRDILLAGIIIGVLGILDDITISQSAIVRQLKSVNPKMKFQELFFRTMEVGKDHIASLVNTLILVYASASLPLLLLLTDIESSFLTTINREVIAEPIIQTLLTSIGLIIAVPISTLIAAYFTSRESNDSLKDVELHEHVH
jgi:uncharacterized membrane protein